MRFAKRAAAVIVSLAAITLLGSVFAPTLCRSRETANRVKCASGMKQIGIAIRLYANKHGGAFPDSLSTLARYADLVPEVFTCPSSIAERAESMDAFIAGQTKDNCSYVYTGAGLTLKTATPETRVLVEYLENHDNDGISILFADGTVDFFVVNRRNPPRWVNDLADRSIPMNETTASPVR